MITRTAIIPARGGSKRFPGKNKALLGGKPLVMHTIDALCGSGLFTKIIFTSDSDELLDIVRSESSSSIECHRRPDELATDTSKALQVVEYYYLQESADQIWLCLPTCPLRSIDDCVAAVAALTEDMDGVVSVTDYEFPPTLSLLEVDGVIVENNPLKPFATGNTRSQDHGRILRPNGAFYGMWWDRFGENRNFFKGRVSPYYMPRERSADIDTELDLKIAETILGASK